MIILQLDNEQLSNLIQDAVRKVITNIPQADSSKETDIWFDIDELCRYLPDKPAKATVYGWVHIESVPYHKGQGQKKLRFLKSEIDEWLKQGRKKTFFEVAAEADTYINKKGLNNG